MKSLIRRLNEKTDKTLLDDKKCMRQKNFIDANVTSVMQDVCVTLGQRTIAKKYGIYLFGIFIVVFILPFSIRRGRLCVDFKSTMMINLMQETINYKKPQ